MPYGHHLWGPIQLRQLQDRLKRRNPQPTAIGQGFQGTRKRITTHTGADPLKDLDPEGQPSTDQMGPATAMGQGNPLSPLASLCLGVVRGWINVARKGKGGQKDPDGTPWTRLPAEQLRDQLEDEYNVSVHTRTIQRALKELATTGHLRRQQRWKHRYRRDYWYSVPEREEQLRMHLPRTVASRYRSERQERSVPTETTRRSLQVLQTRISNTHFSKQPASETRTDDGQRALRGSTTPETAGTRKETHMGEVDHQKRTGNAGKGPLRGLVEHLHGMKVVRTRPTPQGFDPTPGHQVMERQVKQLEIGGRTYKILEDPRTAPIK